MATVEAQVIDRRIRLIREIDKIDEFRSTGAVDILQERATVILGQQPQLRFSFPEPSKLSVGLEWTDSEVADAVILLSRDKRGLPTLSFFGRWWTTYSLISKALVEKKEEVLRKAIDDILIHPKQSFTRVQSAQE